MTFVCLLALSLSAHWHTYIHLKHENGDKWYKNGGWTITYIENVYTRYLPILHNSFLFCTDNSCTSLKTKGLDQ